MHRLVALTLAAALAAPSLAQGDTSQELTRAFAEWRLTWATSAPAPATLEALRALEVRTARARKEAPDDGDLAALYADIEAQLEALAPAPASKPAAGSASEVAQDLVIDEAVVNAVGSGDSGLIQQLGARATPKLLELARNATGGTLPTGQLDPLRTLFELDTHSGLDAVLTLMESGDVLKKSYAASVLEELNAFARDGVWEPVGDSDWQPREARWARILPAALEEPGVNDRLVDLSVAGWLFHGHLPSIDMAIVDRAMKRLGTWTVVPASARPVVARMLAHERASIRRKGVAAQLKLGDPAPAFALAADPDPLVRKEIANALQGWWVYTYTSPDRGEFEQGRKLPDNSIAFRQAATRLAADEDPEIRRNAIKGAQGVARASGAAVFADSFLKERLALATTWKERWSLLEHANFAPAHQRVALVRAGLEAAAAASGTVEEKLGDLARVVDPSLLGIESEDDFYAILDAVEANGLFTPEMKGQAAEVARREIAERGRSADRFIDWILRVGGKEAMAIRFGDRYFFPDTGDLPPWLEKASSPARADAIRLLARHQPGSLIRLDRETYAIDIDSLLNLACDAGEVPGARIAALDMAMRQHGAELGVEHLDVLLAGAADSARSLEIVRGNLKDPGLGDEFAARALASPRVADKVLLGARGLATGAVPLAAALRRFPPETWAESGSSDLIKDVVQELVQGSSDVFDARLEFANVNGSELQRSLIFWIGRERSEVLLPLLERVVANAYPGGQAWSEGIGAVSGYFSDEAAAILLREARRASQPETRQVALDALAQMTAWRDAAASWEKSRGAAQKREQALAGLVAIIDDAAQPAAVRAEAVRGLGLLDAVEELPRLVQLLTSPDAALKAAAREAIDRLHAD